MSWRIFFFLAGLIPIGVLHAQDHEPEGYYKISAACDTLYEELHAKKILVYTYGYETYLLSYRDFVRAFNPWYKDRKRNVRDYNKAKAQGQGQGDNAGWEDRFSGVEAFYASARRQAAVGDTIRLNNDDFSRNGFGQPIDFSNLIDEGRCIIEDTAHIRYPIILRRRATHSGGGMLDGWGGRLYFLPGRKDPFTSGTDWMS